MNGKRWVVLSACIVGAGLVASVANVSYSQETKKPDKIAYQDGDGNWKVVAIEKIKKTDKAPPSKIVKAQDGPTFNVTYLDVNQNTNIGFDDPVDGADRRATLEAVLFYFSTLLEETGECDLEVEVSQTDGTGPLGTGGPYYLADPGFNPGLAYRHIVFAADPMVGIADAILTIDFGYNYNDDTGPVGPLEFDLFSLLLHEITHVLGHASIISETGDSQVSPNAYTVYDGYLYTGGGVQLINPSTFAFQAQVSDLTSNNIEFRGIAAMANFGGAVPIYAPSPWASGSSLSHWDDGFIPEPVMSRSLPNGAEQRAHELFEIGALLDLGYRIGADPEPLSVRSEIWNGYE